jgi:hypothetical protein|nr:MAG TPA: hypothetical protein [Caudoviricetes sp.]
MSAINKYFNDTITLPVIHHDYKTYDWNSAKYGTIVVDPKNNNIGIKLKYNVDNRDPKDPYSQYGPSWIALKLPYNETIIVEESSRFITEQIIYNNYDEVEGILYYTINGNPKESKLTRQDNFIFELDKGSYTVGLNQIKALINNTIECTSATNTLKELDETRFILNPEMLQPGCEINVYYIERYNIGNPIPRIYSQETEPTNPEPGDMWINSKKSEVVKQRLPMTLYIRYDYNNMQLLLLIKSIENSTFKVLKNGQEIVNQQSNHSWVTLKIPIAYNENYTLRVQGHNNDYISNEVSRLITTTSKVSVTLRNTTLSRDNVSLSLQGETGVEFVINSTADIGNVNFAETNGNYIAVFPRKARSYYINIIAIKKDKISFHIDKILIQGKEPTDIPISIIQKDYQFIDKTNQYINIVVETAYFKEAKMITNANTDVIITNKEVTRRVDNGITYYQYKYTIPLKDTVQYISFMATDDNNNAISSVVTAVIQQKRTKLINASVTFVNESCQNIDNITYQKINVNVDRDVLNPVITINVNNPHESESKLVMQNNNTFTYLVPVISWNQNVPSANPDIPNNITFDFNVKIEAYGYIDKKIVLA